MGHPDFMDWSRVGHPPPFAGKKRRMGRPAALFPFTVDGDMLEQFLKARSIVKVRTVQGFDDLSVKLSVRAQFF
jgi:hypothetical protein